jgi:hypothetical protein
LVVEFEEDELLELELEDALDADEELELELWLLAGGGGGAGLLLPVEPPLLPPAEAVWGWIAGSLLGAAGNTACAGVEDDGCAGAGVAGCGAAAVGAELAVTGWFCPATGLTSTSTYL